MVSLLTPNKALETLAGNVQARRLDMGLTQAGLSSRSGVPLSTLRKFEQTGAASIEVLCKLLMVVGGLEDVVEASAPKQSDFTTIDEVLKADGKPKRKHGWRS